MATGRGVSASVRSAIPADGVCYSRAQPAAVSTPALAHTRGERTLERLEPLAEGPEVSPPGPGAQAPAEHLGQHRLALLDAKIF
jgi:hypothetical protein